MKFKTIADLMGRMGYDSDSAEMRSLALLWLESVSGIPFSRPRTEAAALKAIRGYRRTLRDSARQLEAEVIARGLVPGQIDLLIYAARHPELLSILEKVRDLVATLQAGEDDVPDLKVAEEDE